MILDYNYNSRQRTFTISYIDSKGHKKIMKRNVNRFKSYYYTPDGSYDSWDGAKCDVKWVERPKKFDIKTYLRELPEEDYNTIMQKVFPRVYTFDIETMIAENNEFPEPSVAKQPITTISIVSPEMNTIVLGTRALDDSENQYVSDEFDSYLDNTEFFKELHLEKPKFRYIKFDSERDMLRYFLNNIVAKVPILSGWNCIGFDWYYISTRIKNYFPDLSLSSASPIGMLEKKTYADMRGNKTTLLMPVHTLILDMMEVIRVEDFVVLPIKESYGLDYIAHESMGINKIEYDGTLQDLYNKDYPKYVYYNAIDSILVQLINWRFKTLDHIYMYSLYCMEKIGKCFSKIATTEALVFQDFYNRGLKIVTEDKESVDRGRLIGAYVKKPIPGIHRFVCCNDFASLYPSTIRTCNLSFENFIGAYYDDETLKKYRANPDAYVIIGPNVFVNEGNAMSPVTGRQIGTFLNEKELSKYRGNKDYFVSVNGSVYKNDKDYTFRRIQATLKANRDSSKYLGKKLEATAMSAIDHIFKGEHFEDEEYSKEIHDALAKIQNIDVNRAYDFKKFSKEQLADIKRELRDEITYYSCHEQAMKLLMNSMYGGSSHVSFYWFNMELANDITGESRNLIHKMEHHIPEYWKNNWMKMTDVHKALGIEVDEEQAKKALADSPLITEEMDPNAYHDHSFVYVAYGDTDSLYMSYENLLKTIKGYDKMSTERLRDILIYINTNFLDRHNEQFIKEYYDTRFGKSVHNFELEVIALSGVWLDVKKRYGLVLVWKDGRIYDMDDLPMKVKGLEIIKRSFPGMSRMLLKRIVRYLLDHAGEDYLAQKINIEMQKAKREFEAADIDTISGSVKVNNYYKYIVDDEGAYLQTQGVCPWNVRALGQYNRLRNYYHLEGEPMYGGLVKWYITKNSTNKYTEYFAYKSQNWPKWAKQYADIDRDAMFEQTVINPMNRIMDAIGMTKLNCDGSMQMSLF